MFVLSLFFQFDYNPIVSNFKFVFLFIILYPIYYFLFLYLFILFIFIFINIIFNLRLSIIHHFISYLMIILYGNCVSVFSWLSILQFQALFLIFIIHAKYHATYSRKIITTYLLILFVIYHINQKLRQDLQAYQDHLELL